MTLGFGYAFGSSNHEKMLAVHTTPTSLIETKPLPSSIITTILLLGKTLEPISLYRTWMLEPVEPVQEILNLFKTPKSKPQNGAFKGNEHDKTLLAELLEDRIGLLLGALEPQHTSSCTGTSQRALPFFITKSNLLFPP